MLMQCIGIVAMVLGHADIGTGNIPTLFRLVFPYYSWHMPFFIFISGYLFNRNRPVHKYILGKCRTLLFPGLVANGICGLFSATLRYLDLAAYGREITLSRLFIIPFTSGYQFYINVALWYVFALFTIEIMACLMDRLAKGKLDVTFTLISLVVSLLCCMCAYYNHAATRNSYIYTILRFGFLLFFFWFGALYRSHLEKYLQRWLNLKTALILFCIICLFYGFTSYQTTYYTRDMNLSGITVPNGFWIPIIISVFTTFFLLSISYTLSPYVKDSRLLLWLSTNTKYVVYWHQLCFVFFSFVIYALYCLGIIPQIDGFALEDLYKQQYYVSSNPYIAIVNVVFSIFVPIVVCRALKRIFPKWLMAICGAAVVLLIIGCLFLVSAIIH